MNVSISLPDDIAHQLADQWRDLARHALEALTVDAYRRGVITAAQVQRALGLASRFELEAFLKEAGAHLDYTEDDLQADLATFRAAASA